MPYSIRRAVRARCANSTSYLRLPTAKRVDLDDSERLMEYLASKDRVMTTGTV